MRRFFIALILLAWSPGSEATYPGAEYFLHSELNLSYWSNHCRRSDMEILYYTGVTEALNAYIIQRRKDGVLHGIKKFEINAEDPVAHGPAPGVVLSQNRRGYHIYIAARRSSGFNLHLLVQLVEYFASPTWRFFACCKDYDQVAAWGTLHRILDKEVGEPDMSFFKGRRSIVFEAGDLQVIYENDRLFYALEDKRLDLEPGDPVPVRVGQRYLFGSRDFFHVYESGVEVQRRSKPQECKGSYEPVRTQVQSKWVNISCGLRYVYEENRFYENSSTGGHEYDQVLCSDEPGGGEVLPPPLQVIHEPNYNEQPR